VQMSVVNIEQIHIISNTVVKVTAVLRWGNREQQDVAEVDILPGAMVSFPCSFVEVIARNESFRPPVTPGDPETGIFDATVSASVGYGPRAPTGLPGAFRTVDYVSPPFGAGAPPPLGPDQVTRARPIPRWASAGVVVYDPSDTNVLIIVSDTNRPIYTVVAASGDTFPLVAPAFQVQVKNIGAGVTITNLRIQYALII